ncbi:hypothetical protein QTP70_030296, partial [Hemibagrus guttatus]
VNFQRRWNLRRRKECFITGQHVSLQGLKERKSRDKMAEYLLNEIPPYPTPAEFWVSEVAHVTEESGFEGILESEQFSPIAGELSWWGLKINEDEIKEAQKRYMDTNFLNEAQELDEQEPFLEKFTTSPPFQLEKSRYGNYRFTFPLTDLMERYKKQNCGGEDPVLRVHETITYRQEIMYTVLIHSPEDNERFGEYPLLEAKVAHATEETGFKGILESEEFNPPNSEFSWWDLKINKDEIKTAEKNYMERNIPSMAQELCEEKSFLEKFTTSPLFKLEESRYGNYRFTFPLTELMERYKKQNCGGEDPVLRVYGTMTYKQEIVYTVLIHSPEDNERFGEYPLLEASEWVRYQDGKIIWRAQAICETHWYQFISGEVQKPNDYEFYVWDQVSLVFHLPNSKALKIPREQLIEALKACEIANIDLSEYPGTKSKMQRYMEAKEEVSKLKIELKYEEKEEKDEDQKDEDEAKP